MRVFLASFFLGVFFLAAPAIAFEDPTGGKPFFPWIWQDHIKPTVREGFDCRGTAILLATAGATIGARQYDAKMRDDLGDHNHMPADVSRIGDLIGSGYPSAAFAVAGLIWDQPNGLLISRAVFMTAISHQAIARGVNRERPNHGPHSFPSGHTSTSFALAGSLAYAYGPWVGIPAIALAAFVGASRIADNAHWFSDTVAAAGLGLFWARASARVNSQGASSDASLLSGFSPGFVGDTPTIQFSKAF